LVARHLRVGGRFLERGDEKLAGSHGTHAPATCMRESEGSRTAPGRCNNEIS
jgi:hypothetical protein